MLGWTARLRGVWLGCGAVLRRGRPALRTFCLCAPEEAQAIFDQMREYIGTSLSVRFHYISWGWYKSASLVNK